MQRTKFFDTGKEYKLDIEWPGEGSIFGFPHYLSRLEERMGKRKSGVRVSYVELWLWQKWLMHRIVVPDYMGSNPISHLYIMHLKLIKIIEV